MNALTRLDSFDELLPEMFRRFARPSLLPGDASPDIRLDVTEHDKEYLVRAEIPGARKEDIHVTVDGNFISIVAEVRKEKEEKSGGRVLMKETCVGRASRGFTLAHEIDSKAVQAKLENGMLNLTLPKRESGSSRKIAIQ
jgi:HSP20 family protein